MDSDIRMFIVSGILIVLFCVVLPLFMRRKRVDPNADAASEARSNGAERATARRKGDRRAA